MFTSLWASDNMQTITDPVKVFETGYLQVVGTSEEGQTRYKAVRAAQVVAQRDMVEVIEGLSLYGTTSIKDGMLQSDEINTTVKGFLRGAVKCGENYDAGKGYAEVCMRVNIRGKGGLYDIILPLMKEDKLMPDKKPAFNPPSPALVPKVMNTEKSAGTAADVAVAATIENVPAPQPGTSVQTGNMPKPEVKAPSQLTNPYDGLIVDARDFRFRPALVNRVLTENDEVVFEPSKILSNILVERGCGGFTTDDGKAKALLESWGSKNPMIVKSTDVQKFTDAKITKDDAAAIYVHDQKSNLLAQARVVFILK
jgi:hypothetical protein